MGHDVDQATIDRELASFQAKRAAMMNAEERGAERLQTIDPNTVRRLLDNGALAMDIDLPPKWHPFHGRG